MYSLVPKMVILLNLLTIKAQKNPKKLKIYKKYRKMETTQPMEMAKTSNGTEIEAQIDLFEKDKKVLADLKEKIKKLPLNERVTAVALYRKIQAHFAALYPFEQSEAAETEESDFERSKLVQTAHQLIQGERACNEAELKGIEHAVKEEEEFDNEKHNVPHRIEDYWIQVFKNAHISK